MDQARAVRVVRRDHDDRREDAGGGRGRVAPAAARGGRAGGGAWPRGARDGLASDCTRAHSARAGRALRAAEGETRAAALPAAGLRPPRARVRPRPGHLPAGVRGRLAQPAGPPRRLRELAVLGRRGKRSALDPLPDPARDADRRDAARYCGAWDDWQAATRGDSTRRHWDAWPRPEYGTLEVRVLDQPTSVRRTAELAAEVQRLVREAAEFDGLAVRPRRVRGAARRRRPRGRRAGGRAPARARAGGCRPGDRRR